MLLMRHLFTEYTKVHSSQCYFVCLASRDLNKKGGTTQQGLWGRYTRHNRYDDCRQCDRHWTMSVL